MDFWTGFEKQAAASMKGLRSGMGITANSSQMLIGARPRSGVAVASAFKPNKLPAAGNTAAAHNNTAATITKPISKVPPAMPVQKMNGVGGVTI